MDVTIVIPVLNGEKYIRKCLESLQNALVAESSYSICVIDNGSIDNTVSILEKMNIEYSVHKDCTIGKLRNIGAMSCKSDLIGFVDSDCFVMNDWLTEAKSVFQKDTNIGAVGRYYGIPDKPSWVEKIWFEMRKDVEGPVSFLPGGNIIFRRSIFEEISGFNEKLVTGEDYDICERTRENGYIVYNSPKVNVVHMGNYKSLSSIVRKERWYGKGMYSENAQLSKPLLATLLFTVTNIILLVSIVTEIRLTLYLLPLYLMMMVIFASGFSKHVKKNKLLFIIKIMPIAFCYLLGRSLSLFDFIFRYFINRLKVSQLM